MVVILMKNSSPTNLKGIYNNLNKIDEDDSSKKEDIKEEQKEENKTEEGYNDLIFEIEL